MLSPLCSMHFHRFFHGFFLMLFMVISCRSRGSGSFLLNGQPWASCCETLYHMATRSLARNEVIYGTAMSGSMAIHVGFLSAFGP